ncbi:MAG: hypothetical protein IJ731_04580 [Eubacterium sp.]|nr:hypothetical protein [Eubacterium sp.]
MKKLSKRLLSLMLAAIMAMPVILAVPSTASAQSFSNLSPTKYGLVKTGGNRGNGNKGNIVNDGGNDNTSAMLWEFDLTGISDDYIKVDSATFSLDVWDINNKNIANQQLDFYYCDPAGLKNRDGYLNNSNYTDSTNIHAGDGTTAPDSFKSAFGINSGDYIGYRTHSYDSNSATITFSNDALKNAIKKAHDEGWRSIVFVVMHNRKASSTWSDIWAGLPKLSFTTSTISAKEFAQSKISAYSASENLKTTGAIKFSGGGDAYSTNVLYSNNGNYDSTYFEGVLNGKNKFGFNIYPASSRVVYLYDSNDSVVQYPLIAKGQRIAASATTVHWGINYLAVNNSPNWSLYRDWNICNGDRIWKSASPTSGNYGTDIINYDIENTDNYNSDISVGGWGSTSGSYTNDGSRTYSNIVKFDSSLIDFSDSYIYTISDLPVFKANVDGAGHWIGNQAAWNNIENKNWNNITINGKQSITLKVLNVKPLKDIVTASDFKTRFNDVVNNEWMYTAESLANFYKAYAEALCIVLKGYDYSTDTGLNAVASKISTAVSDVNSYKNPTLNTFTITYNRADGNRTETVTAGNKLASIPSNSTTAHIASTNTHNVYNWSTSSGVWDLTSTPSGTHIPHSNETYYEAATPTSCSFANDVHTATNEHNGYTDKKCSACGNVDLTQIAYNPLDWSTYDTKLAAYNTAITSDNYTDDSIATCTTAVTAATLNKASTLPSNTPQSTVDNAANAIDSAVSALIGRAAFGALDTAKANADAWANASARADEYTGSSIQAYKDYLNSVSEFPYENNASRTNTPVSDQTLINSEITKYNNAQTYAQANILDPLADLTYFDAEFDKANTFLMNLDGKTAEYTADSVQAVIDAVTAAGNAQGSNKSVQTIATANAATRKVDFGQKVQADANSFADDIRDAMAGLEKASSVVPSTDTSAFEAAVEKLNNIDPDAYDVSEGDIASIRRSANATISSSESHKEYNGATINVLNDNITQQDIDDATTAITTALTVSTKRYTINKSGDGADFDISSKNGTYENGSATYGTTIVANSGDADTAWYLEIQTGSMHKKMAFAGNGQRLQTKVLGTTTIKAVKRATGQKKVRILRQYDNAEITDRSPVQVVDYVSGEFTLPAATAIAYYTFSGYYVGGTQYAAGDVVSISEDTDIIAKYTADANANCAINATGYTGTVKYNDKVELTGNDDTYAWVEEVDSLGTHYRPFYIGKNVSFFASESSNLKAVTKSEFDAFKFSLPTVNLRKSGVVSEGAKTIFNAQIVPGDANVQEYGILIAAPYGATPAASIDATQVVIENSGKHASEGYQVLRAKSTKLVGANQFTISVNGIPSGYIYRGYLIYADSNGNLHNVYSEAMR